MNYWWWIEGRKVQKRTSKPRMFCAQLCEVSITIYGKVTWPGLQLMLSWATKAARCNQIRNDVTVWPLYHANLRTKERTKTVIVNRGGGDKPNPAHQLGWRAKSWLRGESRERLGCLGCDVNRRRVSRREKQMTEDCNSWWRRQTTSQITVSTRRHYTLAFEDEKRQVSIMSEERMKGNWSWMGHVFIVVIHVPNRFGGHNMVPGKNTKVRLDRKSSGRRCVCSFWFVIESSGVGIQKSRR